MTRVQTMRGPVILIMLLSFSLGGCDKLFGVKRTGPVGKDFDRACLLSALRDHPMLRACREVPEVPGTLWCPAISGQGPHVQIEAGARVVITYLDINRPPPNVRAARSLMTEIAKVAHEKCAGFPAPPELTESCMDVACP